MKKAKTALLVLLAAVLLPAPLAGCRAQDAASAAVSLPDTRPDGEGGAEDSPAIVMTGSREHNEALIELVYQQTGYRIEMVTRQQTPGSDTDTVLFMLQAGDGLDIVYGTTSQLNAYYKAGMLLPMDALAAADGYDLRATYGENLPVMKDGNTYGMPAFRDVWMTIYNKKIFDAAGVAYPPPEGFTWDEYIETARRLTDVPNGIWGSYMLDYDCYNYMLATQKGAQPYKADGTANFDDPRYREALEFFYSLGHEEKIQPDVALFAADSYSWKQFAKKGNVGMWVIGSWALSTLGDQSLYPRDWQIGLAPMPYPAQESPSSLEIIGCYAIPTTCRNPEAAFEVIKCIAENQYTLGKGRIPARVDLSEEELTAFIETVLVPANRMDGITAEEFKASWFDPNRAMYPEKIIGTADNQINEIWLEEGQLYGIDQKTADEAIASIQARANSAIAEESALDS